MNGILEAPQVRKSKRLRADWAPDPTVTEFTARPWFHGEPCARCDSTVRFVKRGYCVRCTKQARKQNHKKNAGKGRPQWRSPLQQSHGLNREKYAEIFHAQEGLCAICRKPESVKQQRLTVDHCHETGKFRGLLCNRCNRGLGFLGDNEDSLSRALAYLRNNAWEI